MFSTTPHFRRSLRRTIIKPLNNAPQFIKSITKQNSPPTQQPYSISSPLSIYSNFQPPYTVIQRNIFWLLAPKNHARAIGLGRQINNTPQRSPFPGAKKLRREMGRPWPRRNRIFRNRWAKVKLMFDSFHKSHSNIQDSLDAWNLAISPQWRATRYNAFFRMVRIPKTIQRYYGYRKIKWMNDEFDQRVKAGFRQFIRVLGVLFPRMANAEEKFEKRKGLVKIATVLVIIFALLREVDPGEMAGQEAIEYMQANALEMTATVAKILHQHDMFHYRKSHFHNMSIIAINRALGRGKAGVGFNNIEEHFQLNLDTFLDNPLESLPGNSHRQTLAPYTLDTLLHVLFTRSNIQLKYRPIDPQAFLDELNQVHVRTLAPFKRWKANTPNALALTQDYNFKINFFRVYDQLRKRPTLIRDLKDLYDLNGKTMEYYYDVLMEELYHDKLLNELQMLQKMRQHLNDQALAHGYHLPECDITPESIIIDLTDPRHALALAHLNYLTKNNAVAFPLFPNPLYEKHYTDADRLYRAQLPKPGVKHSGWHDAFQAIRLKYSPEMLRLMRARELQHQIIQDLSTLQNINDEIHWNQILSEQQQESQQQHQSRNNTPHQNQNNIPVVIYKDKVLSQSPPPLSPTRSLNNAAATTTSNIAQSVSNQFSTWFSNASSSILSWAHASPLISEEQESTPSTTPENPLNQEFDEFMIYNTNTNAAIPINPTHTINTIPQTANLDVIPNNIDNESNFFNLLIKTAVPTNTNNSPSHSFETNTEPITTPLPSPTTSTSSTFSWFSPLSWSSKTSTKDDLTPPTSHLQHNYLYHQANGYLSNEAQLVDSAYIRTRDRLAQDIIRMQGLLPALLPRLSKEQKELGLTESREEYSDEPPILLPAEDIQFLYQTPTLTTFDEPFDALHPTTFDVLNENKSIISQRENREMHGVKRLSEVLGVPEQVILETTSMTISELMAARMVLQNSQNLYNPYDTTNPKLLQMEMYQGPTAAEKLKQRERQTLIQNGRGLTPMSMVIENRFALSQDQLSPKLQPPHPQDQIHPEDQQHDTATLTTNENLNLPQHSPHVYQQQQEKLRLERLSLLQQQQQQQTQDNQIQTTTTPIRTISPQEPHNKQSLSKKQRRQEYFASKQLQIAILNPHQPELQTPELQTILQQPTLHPPSSFSNIINQLHQSRNSSVFAPLQHKIDSIKTKFKNSLIKLSLSFNRAKLDLLTHPLTIRAQSYLLPHHELLEKKKFATQYQVEKKRIEQEDLINGVTSDRDRYRYDYLSSVAARLDTCMLQIHFELKRIHKKPTFITHPDQLVRIVPLHEEYEPLPDQELEHLSNPNAIYSHVKSWGDEYNPIQNLEASELLRDTQITYV